MIGAHFSQPVSGMAAHSHVLIVTLQVFKIPAGFEGINKSLSTFSKGF